MDKAVILEKSKELVNQIFAKMSVIESCDTVVDMIKGLEVCFYNPENQKNVVLTEVMRLDQLTEIRESIISKIHSNSFEAQNYLERLGRKPATINPGFEAAVQGMVQSKDKPIVIDPTKDEPEFPPVTKTPSMLPGKNILNKGKDTKEMNLIVEDKLVPPKPSEILEQHAEEIEKMYKVQMDTIGSIAEKFGVKKTDVNTFLAKHKLFRKAYKKEDGFLDAKVEAKHKQLAETECL